MANGINIGALVSGLGIGLNQGQQLRANNQRLKRQAIVDRREDEQYSRQQNELAKRDEFRNTVKSTLDTLDPADNFGTATALNDLALRGALIDPEGAKSLVPLAQLNMEKHARNVSQKGIAALQTENAQELAALSSQLPGFEVDKNEDGTYKAAYDPATKQFQFSVQGQPTILPTDQVATMLQSITEPGAAINFLQTQAKANVKEVNGGLYDVRSGQWILEPKGEKPTVVNNGGENILVDSKGNEIARFKKSSEPTKTSIVKHEGGSGGGVAKANSVQSRVPNADGTWSLIMRDGTTKLAVDESGKPIVGVTQEQLKRLDISGKVYAKSNELGAENPAAEAAAAGGIPLPQPDAVRNRPPAAGGVTPPKKPTVSNW